MRTNVVAKNPHKTHEGGQAARQTAEQELMRTVASCLLFEDTFYESGNSIADRISTLCEKVPATTIADLAVRAKEELYLRHTPLWLARNLARLHNGRIVGDTIDRVIRRADELPEFLAMYWRGQSGIKKSPLSSQVKKGLARAFTKFDAYQLAKYNRDEEVKLRDVMFLSHPKPKDAEQAATWKKLVDGTIETPETWEVLLSAGKDKKETFTSLLSEGKLGYLALIRNLRNMEQAGVDRALVVEAVKSGAPKSRLLPFQFIAAYKNAPAFAQALDFAMQAAIKNAKGLDRDTTIVVDVSGSMDAELSRRGTLTRIDAAAALAVLFRGLSSDTRVFTFSNSLVEVPAASGLGLVKAIYESQQHSGTWLGKALDLLRIRLGKLNRVIVITDEQAHDSIVPLWAEKGYIVNVAPYAPGLQTSGGWVRINGFSDRIVQYLQVYESGKWGD